MRHGSQFTRTALLIAFSSLVSPRLVMGQGAPVSDSHRTAVVELLRVSQVERMIEQSKITMIDAMLGEAPPQLRQVFDEFFDMYFSWAQLEAQYVELYAATLTEPEVRELAAFYATPIGAKLVEVSPLLMEGGSVIGQRQVEAHLPELERMIQEAMSGNAAR